MDDSNEERKPEKIRKGNGIAYSQSAESPPRTPPQAPRDLTSLTKTPNKRPLNEEILQ
jgi:hypothetical protein